MSELDLVCETIGLNCCGTTAVLLMAYVELEWW
jgi:hypothetical protein